MAKTPKYNVNKIAGNIKKKRTKLDLSREELAKKAKVNYNTIIKLESGANKNPTIKTLLGLANVFGCPVEELIK
ncbi:helix-turn-helix transcriptional regulator [Patescibacteria group bacterium]|jgi:transcriptional regulator with XRE-family HTH domain|nr:helix-turn-helix transcriptional regulator [Patescibacteria group bacterium]